MGHETDLDGGARVETDRGCPLHGATMRVPRVTVGIPTFNRAGLLREAIDSVLAQTFTDFRLIVSDNASDDDTREVVRSYDDGRIDYVRLDRNVGAIENFNRLIALVETEFLVLLPDDDLLYPGHLAAAVDLLEHHPSAGLAHCAFHMIDARSRFVRRVDPLVSHAPVMIERRDRALERLMVSGLAVLFSTVVYRTKVIVDAGGFREEDGPFGDSQLWMRIALGWDFGYVAAPLACYRDHPETISRSLVTDRASASRELSLIRAQMGFERRMSFLEDARLPPRRTEWLRARATLRFLVDRAFIGHPSRKVAAELVSLVRTCPRIVRCPALWRLVLAQLGGRRVRAELRGILDGLRGPGPGHPAESR
jgi:glycosyltransferase involved in cell wall biosynthesis